MRNLVAITVISLSLSFSAMAQAYDVGVNIFDVGIGFGKAYGNHSYRWGTFGYGAAVPVSASYEIGFHKYFSAGPYVAFATRSFETDYRQNFFGFGAKGSFHYTSLLNYALDTNVDEDKLDLYLSFFLGAEFYSDNDNDRFDNASTLDIGTVIGGRYLVDHNFSVFTELGYAPLAIWTIGLSLEL
jgi:hypothetical protein